MRCTITYWSKLFSNLNMHYRCVCGISEREILLEIWKSMSPLSYTTSNSFVSLLKAQSDIDAEYGDTCARGKHALCAFRPHNQQILSKARSATEGFRTYGKDSSVEKKTNNKPKKVKWKQNWKLVLKITKQISVWQACSLLKLYEMSFLILPINAETTHSNCPHWVHLLPSCPG